MNKGVDPQPVDLSSADGLARSFVVGLYEAIQWDCQSSGSSPSSGCFVHRIAALYETVESLRVERLPSSLKALRAAPSGSSMKDLFKCTTTASARGSYDIAQMLLASPLRGWRYLPCHIDSAPEEDRSHIQRHLQIVVSGHIWNGIDPSEGLSVVAPYTEVLLLRRCNEEWRVLTDMFRLLHVCPFPMPPIVGVPQSITQPKDGSVCPVGPPRTICEPLQPSHTPPPPASPGSVSGTKASYADMAKPRRAPTASSSSLLRMEPQGGGPTTRLAREETIVDVSWVDGV